MHWHLCRHFLLSQPVRKFIPFIFLAVVLLHTTGVHFFFYGNQLKLKVEVQRLLQSITSEELEELQFTVQEFEALKNAHGAEGEFRIGGEMYDIKSVEQRGNKVIVRVLHDTEEEGLLKLFSSLFEKNNSSKSTNNNIQDNTLPEFTLQKVTFVFADVVNVIGIKSFQSSLLKGNLQLLCPPPDFCNS